MERACGRLRNGSSSIPCVSSAMKEHILPHAAGAMMMAQVLPPINRSSQEQEAVPLLRRWIRNSTNPQALEQNHMVHWEIRRNSLRGPESRGSRGKRLSNRAVELKGTGGPGGATDSCNTQGPMAYNKVELLWQIADKCVHFARYILLIREKDPMIGMR
jgi:hypothetical protein